MGGLAQRHSEYARIAGDTYVTPGWVWEVLWGIDPDFEGVTDCCPANADFDFLATKEPIKAVATNPPFSIADAIIIHALNRTRPMLGKVAMLLPVTFDCAKRRLDLWKPPFKTKVVLTRRIRWENLEQKKNGPSTNHAWYIWDWTQHSAARIIYI